MFPATPLPGLSAIASWMANVGAREDEGEGGDLNSGAGGGGGWKLVGREWGDEAGAKKTAGGGLGLGKGSGIGFGREPTTKNSKKKQKKKKSSGEEHEEEERKERTPANMVRIICVGCRW